MNDFTYYMPTRVFWGEGCLARRGDAISRFGTRALVVTGKTSARVSGAMDDIAGALGRNGISFAVFDEVEANPSIETARRAGAAARSFDADFILAAGGGSPLDAGKAAAVLAGNECADDDLFSGNFSNPVLPVIAIPTTAGTGSEATPYSILTDTVKKTKRNLKSDRLFPVLTFLDPRYTDSLSAEITASTAIDALTHALEGYLSTRATPASDMFALRSMAILGPALAKLSGSAPGREDRQKFLYASFLAGCVIAQTGTTVLHAMGYHLTIFHCVEHGRANGLLLVPYLRHVMSGQPERVREVLGSLGCEGLAGLGRMLGPLMKGDVNLADAEIDEYARIAVQSPSAACTLPRPTTEDICEMYRNAAGLNKIRQDE